MEKKKPTIGQIQEYLKKYNPLNLSGALIKLISEHNHLHYRLEKDDKVFCLRMINPESYRRGEWIDMPEEHVVLKYLEGTGLGPKSYFVDAERFVIPLMIQEFITDAVCFNDLKPLSKEHLITTAQAIARLNEQDITPERFPFRKGFTRYSYLTSIKTWQERLAIIKKAKQKDVLEWADKIGKVVDRAAKILKGFEPLLQKTSPAFNFDGAHCGNTYWKNNQVIFLDWQKVSYGDPCFTLARFLTSVGKSGKVYSSDKELMIETYQTYFVKKANPDFPQLVDQRLFERSVADLVWVLWRYVKRGKTEPIDMTPRYRNVEMLLEQY